MQVVGPGLDVKVRHSGLSAVVLRANRSRLQFELADRLRGGAELVVVASRKVGAADGNALDQNLVRIFLPTVNRSLECVARRAGQTAEDEALNLPLAIVHQDRPALVFLNRYVAPDLGRARIEERRLVTDRHPIADLA